MIKRYIPLIRNMHFLIHQFQISTCLERLESENVDLLYLHAPDHNTDIEETMRVMNDLYTAGKYSRLGLSNYSSWEVAR